jgi:hypothetical protein
VIFMELKIIFRYKQCNVCLQRISKVFTGHLTVRRGIQENARHVMMVNKTTTSRERKCPKGVSETFTPRKSGANATLKVGCFF